MFWCKISDKVFRVKTVTEDDITIFKLNGFWAWLIMALSILAYDIFAIKTKKAETMSTALWRMLQNPTHSPALMMVWLSITYHLFINKQARSSYKMAYVKITGAKHNNGI